MNIGAGGKLLVYLTGRRRPAVLPVGEERAVEGLGVGVGVRAGRGQEPDVVGQNGGPNLRLGDVSETPGDDGPSCSQGAEDVQGVVSGLKTCRTGQTMKTQQNHRF